MKVRKSNSIKPLQKICWLLLNEEEAGQILGCAVTDGPAAARALREKLPQTAIVLTLGAEGAVYAGEEGVFAQSAFPVQAVDTTAAGDTFTGYFLAGVLEGMTPQQAMALAAKASAISVTRKGAAPSIPVREEVTL